MKRTGKTAIGIDVTETEVHMVVLRRTPAGCTVLDSARVAIPEHAIEDGRITDPRQLARALKAVRHRSRAAAGSIVISLPARGTLTRIMPLAEQDPQRIGQFVRDELKQYAILSSRETSSDFRVLTPARPDARGAVLVAAADHENVLALTAACRLARLQVGVIEPAAIACARLLGADKTPGSPDKGLLIVLLKETALTLCVFRRGLLDFIRTEILEESVENSATLASRVAEEIAKVSQFYSLRNGDAMKEWKIMLADDTGSSVLSHVQTLLGAGRDAGSTSLVTPDHLPADWTIDLRNHKDLSLTALGLALRGTATVEESSSVNLIPPEVAAARSAQRNMFVMANAAAVLMLTIVVGTGAIAYMGKRVNQNIVALQQKVLKRGEHSLPVTMAEMSHIDEQTQRLWAEVKCFKEINESHSSVDWVRFLDDVRQAMPSRGVRLTKLVSNGGAGATIQGEAASTEAVRAFADALNASTQVRHASPVRMDQSRKDGKRIEYEIHCALAGGKAL